MSDREKRFEFKRGSGNDDWIGPDDGNYTSKAQAMYMGHLGLYACGLDGEGHEFIVKFLKHLEGEECDIDKIRDLIKNNNDLVMDILLGFFHQKSLIEYGTSVYSSWLTERGEQFIEIGADWSPSILGYPIDSKGDFRALLSPDY